MSELTFDADGEKIPATTNDTPREPGPSVEAPAEPSTPPLDPNVMSHLLEIQSALTPLEDRLAREVAASVSPTEMRTWLAALSEMSVLDAVAKIRSFIGARLRKKEKRGDRPAV
jgi:hypothetical protein